MNEFKIKRLCLDLYKIEYNQFKLEAKVIYHSHGFYTVIHDDGLLLKKYEEYNQQEIINFINQNKSAGFRKVHDERNELQMVILNIADVNESLVCILMNELRRLDVLLYRHFVINNQFYISEF